MQQSILSISSVRRIQGKAVLTLSSGESLSMPRAMLKERPYRSGMPFDRAAHEAFITSRAYPFALDKAVSLLACRSRTEREITEALAKNAYPEQIVARVMARLREAGYINDADFAEHWAASRAAKGMGARRIRMELRQKGVSSDTIDETISNMDEEESLSGALSAARKTARGKDLSSPTDRQKVLAALARRGYGFEVAKLVLSQLIDEE